MPHGANEDTCNLMSNTPKVSITMPNLNNRRFLLERFDSIVNQTLTDWELIIVDSYSDDGAWELIQKYAANDRRFRIAQAPRDGIYSNLNRCIAQARGEYIYIATSDDTMSPDCLKIMVSALESYPECGICHTWLTAIDEHGDEIVGFAKLLRPAQFYGDLMRTPHIRLAPYDGILHCALYTVYTSLTQLLIRRSVFEHIGVFRTDWGAESDFEWGMRAGLCCHVLHIPEALATWRIHSQQATRYGTPAYSAKRQKFCQMIRAALPTLSRCSQGRALPNLSLRRLLFPYRREVVRLGMRERRSIIRKLIFILRMFFVSPMAVRDFLILRFLRNVPYVDDLTYIRKEIQRLGLEENIKILDAP